jgi:hypothetical protein
MEITREQFEQQRRPRFGTANPERMQLPFWEWMIRAGKIPAEELARPLGKYGLVMRNGVLKSWYGPCRARDFFKVPVDRKDGPIWTFSRDGASRTELPDGRLVCIAGEHEDSYDPDFYIYNDVVVFTPKGSIEIYGYPKEVFPPTDSHTATLAGDRIIVIGCLGYPDDRRSGQTPVYSVDLSDYHISEMHTSGALPGWISKHEASLDQNGTITIRGGQIDLAERRCLRRNFEDYALDIQSREWHRLTNRNWKQFSVFPEKPGFFPLEHDPELEVLLPRSIDHSVSATDDEDFNWIRILVWDVSVSLYKSVFTIDVVVEGELADDLVRRMVEEIHANVEAAIKQPCELEQV